MEGSKPRPSPSEALYDRCNKEAGRSDERFKKIFTQDALLAFCDTPPLNHIKDVVTLEPVIRELADGMLFITLKSKNGLCWSLRPRDAAAKIKSLSRDERMVYGTIEEAHQSGIWIKSIRIRTNIKDLKYMDKIISRLQHLNLVKNIKNAKTPLQRTYMLFHLAPSDEVTGGSFYDAGDLDESLVEELSNLIVFHVGQMSWVDEKKRIKRESSPAFVRDNLNQTNAGATDGRGRKKRKRETTSAFQAKDIEDSAPPRKHRSHKHPHDPETETVHTQLCFPAGHEYPDAASIHRYITTSDIIRAIKANSLTVDEIQNVLNVLVWDEKLEKVNGGYRTVRGVKFKQPGEEDDEADEEGRKRGNGFTEAPCGRCPVIDICGTGGPVNAANCVYFERWLNQSIAA